MSLRLIQPGRPAAARFPSKHSRAGAEIQPVGYLKDGRAVWPVFGGAEQQDDPDADPDDESAEDDEDDEESDSSNNKKSSKKSSKDDDDEDDEDDEDDHPNLKASRQARRYRLQLREEQQKNRDLNDRIKALEDKDKKPDEIQSRDLADANAKLDKLTRANAEMTAQLAFFRVNNIDWADPGDAFALAEREGLFEDAVDDDGNVDARELRRGLKDLAKRKPHLVKSVDKGRARDGKDDDEDDDKDDEEPRSTRSAAPMNRRKTKQGPSRAELAKRFPVLGKF